MPRDANGAYSLPSGTLVNAGNTLRVSQHNPAMQDLAASVSQSLSRTGQGAMQAPLNLGGHKAFNGQFDGANIVMNDNVALPESLLTRGANAKADFLAKFDGTTDDTAAIQQGINTLAAAGGGALYLPKGSARVTTLHVPQDVMLIGQGKGMTRLVAPVGFNAPIIDRTGSLANVINRGGVQALTIVGSGKANVGCIGIKNAFTNRGVYRDIEIFGTREGMRIENVWQDKLENVHVHGGGTDQSYIGFRFMPRLAVNGISNAVIANGCMAQGVEAYGWRLENANGSKFTSCEGSDGLHAWYLGDPSSGTEAFEFCHFDTCLGDTTQSDIWRIEKGAATAVVSSQYANCWAGTSFAGSGVRVAGASGLAFSNFQIRETHEHGMHFVESSRCSAVGVIAINWDKGDTGAGGIANTNSVGINASGCQLYNAAPGPGHGFVDYGTSDYNTISGSTVANGPLLAPHSIQSAVTTV